MMKKIFAVLLCASALSGCATDSGQVEMNQKLGVIQLQLGQLTTISARPNGQSPDVCYLDGKAYSQGAIVTRDSAQIQCVEHTNQHVSGQAKPPVEKVWKSYSQEKQPGTPLSFMAPAHPKAVAQSLK